MKNEYLSRPSVDYLKDRADLRPGNDKNVTISKTRLEDLHLENYKTLEPTNIEPKLKKKKLTEEDKIISKKINRNERIAAEYNRKNEFMRKLEGWTKYN